ncbi:MAG: tetratricopeptide repeat protein [Planctomycetota bacterium]|nr:tetratricopeptide repeat protein [Planctomycetota bacterium]
MPEPTAETAYLFRHAMIREAAYGLQLPSDRAKLHELAVQLIELVFGGPAPELAPLEDFHAPKPQPHPIDAVASDLAAHARLACEGVESPSPAMLRARLLYLRRAAEHADAAFRPQAAASHWHELSAELAGAAKAAALRRAAVACDACGKPARALELIESALEALQQAPRDVATAFLLGVRANLRIMQGQRQPAIADYEQALEMFQAAGDRAGIASASSSLGMAVARAGQPDRGEALLRDALAIQRESGDLRGQGITLGSLAGLLDDSGESRLAHQYYREALELHRRAETGASRASRSATSRFPCSAAATRRKPWLHTSKPSRFIVKSATSAAPRS